MSHIGPETFRQDAQRVIAKLKEGGKLIDVLVWNTIIGHYEEALAEASLGCAVADAWASHGNRPPSITFESPLWALLTALELATRDSPLRKVKL